MMYEELQEELNLTQLFSISLKVFKSCIKSIIILTIIVYLPINIINNVMIQYKTDPIIVQYVMLGIVLMSSLAIMGISYIVEKNIKESIIIDVNEAFNNSFKNWGKAIVTSLLASLIVLAGLFIFIFPGLFMAINYVFVFNVVALRKKTGIEALRYSRLLLNGRWIKGFGYVVIIGLLNFGLAMIISLITRLIPYNIIIGVIGDTITCCILSFVSVCLSVIFLNLDYTAKTSIS